MSEIPATAESDDYQVRIRSANQKVDDYVTSCSPSWTVLNLKEHISKTHVNKPNVEGQRLIYAGNVLKDSSTLEQIFFRDSLCTELTNFSKKDFTVHMVSQTKVPNRPTSVAGTSAAAPRTSTSAPSMAQAAAGNGPNQFTATNQSNLANNPSQQRAGGQQAMPTNLFSNSINFSPDLSSPDQQYIRNVMQSDQMRQQMATFRQLACLVASQIANNMVQANQNSRNSTSSTTDSSIPISSTSLTGPQLNVQINAHISSHQNETPNNNNNPFAPQLVEPQQFGFGAQIQAAQAAVNHPGNRRAEANAPMHQHDVIDWVYYSVRAFLFLIALYIHASMFRLLFIIGLLLIAYFFSRRSGRRNNSRNEQNPRQQGQNRQNAQVPVQEDAELRRRNVDRANPAGADHNINNSTTNTQTNAEAQGESPDRLPNPPIPDRLPFLKLCYLVVADFLTSLLPQ